MEINRYLERDNEVLRSDTLVLRLRTMNSLNYVLERAYKKGWTYQRFTRSNGTGKSRNVLNANL